MRLWSLIPRLLSILAILGLLTAPMAVPSATEAMAAETMAQMMDMDMPEAMPDCPKEQSQRSDCGKNCPLALICTSAIYAQMPSDHSWSVGVPWAPHRFDMMPHAQLASTLIAPPIRPPKA